MSAGLVADLREQIGRGRAVMIAGAGVAAAASGGEKHTSWMGLLESALTWCLEFVPGLPAGWPGVVQSLLGIGDASSLVTAAEMLTERLGGREGGEYRRWLHETMGSLPVVDRSVPAALTSLGAPVATTNYDGLIEKTATWGTVTWRDGARIQRVLRGDERAVVHLHGYWDDPVSVVLGIRSYEKVLGEGPAQALKRAMASMHSLVFVGMGEGTRDPNFAALRQWLVRTFPGGEYRHFRLCLESEVNALAAEHPPEERIIPVAYGSEHKELGGFLRSLAGSAPVPTASSTVAALALPARRATLGRDAHVAEVVTNLQAEPPAPTVILGPPGIGKTNLTLAVLHHPAIAARYGSRRIFVRCEGAASASAVVTELATVLGLPLTGGDLLAGCLERLATAPVIVCLDNAETPWEAETLATEELFAQLGEVDGVGLVVSMRGAERPGGPSWARPLRLEPLDSDDARALFLSVAGQGFDQPSLDDLLREMGGVPLAVELLAHAAEGEAGLHSLARRFRAERVKLLERSTADRRLLSVAVSVEASWNGPLMTQPARRLLSLLGKLADGVAHSDLDALVPDEGGGAANVLRRRGLAFDEAARLRTYPPLRHHIEAAHPPALADWERTTTHYRVLATELGPKVGWPGGGDAAHRLATETANLTTTLLDALAGGDPRPALDATAALVILARFTGIDLPELFEASLPAAEAMHDRWQLARAQQGLAHMARVRSDHEGARARYNEALALYRQVGDVRGEARCIKGLGDIARVRSDRDGARARYNEALALYRQVGDVLGEAKCISRLGDIARVRSDLESARARYNEALPLFRQVGAVLGEANCIGRLGDVAIAHSDHEGARARYDEALPLYRQIGAVLGEANCVKGLADIALARSDQEGARARYDEALPLYRQFGYVLGEANCIRGLGDIALARSDHQGAQARYDEALPLFRRVGSVLGEANCIFGQGDIALARSDHQEARVRYEEALALYRRIWEPYSIGMGYRQLARLATSELDRHLMVEAARAAWTGIGREDLVRQLDDEFASVT